jgi:hypothetical protein
MAWSIFTQGGGDGAALTWAEDLLNAIGAPVTAGNKQFIYDWEVSEGGGGTFNPLNQGPVPGNPSLTTSGSQYGGGAANYASWQDGIEGSVAYLQMPAYSGILTALMNNDPSAARSALIASPWAASHYGDGSAFSDAAVPGQASALPAGGGGGNVGSGLSGSSDSFLSTFLSGVASVFTGTGITPSDISSAATAISPFSGIADAIAGFAAPFVDIGEKLDWLFVPSHWIRILAGVGGSVLLLGGLYAMTHVGAHVGGGVSVYGVSIPTPTFNLPVAIIMTGAGAVGLFIAFHNVPSNVTNLPQFLGWIAGNIRNQGTTGTAAS